MTEYDATADALTADSALDGEVELDGDTFPISVDEPTLGELEAIENELGEEAEEIDFARRMIDEYLLEPDIPADDIPMTRALALYQAMQSAYMQSDTIQDAREKMTLNQGNP